MLGKQAMLLLLLTAFTLHCKVSATYFQCPSTLPDQTELLTADETLITVPEHPRNQADDNATNPDLEYDNVPKWRMPLDDSQGYVTYSDVVWFELDFGSEKNLIGFATKGANNYRGETWPEEYKVWTAGEDYNFSPVTINGDTVITGNNDKWTVVPHEFDSLITARYFQLEVVSAEYCCWDNGALLIPRQFAGFQAAVYGCDGDEVVEGCQRYRTMEPRDNANGCHGVVPITRCQGPCESIQTVDIPTGRLVSDCPCCSATSTSTETVVYSCDQNTESEEVTVIDACACQNC